MKFVYIIAAVAFIIITWIVTVPASEDYWQNVGPAWKKMYTQSTK